MKNLLLILSLAFTLALTSCSADDATQTLEQEPTTQLFFIENPASQIYGELVSDGVSTYFNYNTSTPTVRVKSGDVIHIKATVSTPYIDYRLGTNEPIRVTLVNTSGTIWETSIFIN